MMNDPELQEIFTDPAYQEVVDLLNASRPARPPLDPHFRSYLRAKLMTEARRTLPARAAQPWFPFSFTPRALVPAMVAVAAGFIVAIGIEIYMQNRPASTLVAADVTQINNKQNVATAEPIQIPFSGPVDKNAIEESLQIEPATSVTTQWVGQTLVIIPDHPLAPNTSYTVTFKPKAAAPAPTPANPVAIPKPTPKPAAAPTPVVVHFTTVPAVVPPVVPPSFRSSNVSYGHDNRLADSGTILNATWTPTGQLLVTRPAGQPGPGSATPSATASPSASPAAKASTDVWLLTAMGTPLRNLAPGGSFPAAASSGGLFASWKVAPENQSDLEIRDMQGNLLQTVVTVDGVPDRPPVWLGTDRIAYIDNGKLKIIGLHAPLEAPALKVDHGSLAASPSGLLLAVETTKGTIVVDLTPGAGLTSLPDGATGFSWSAKGDLAFVVQHETGTDLYVAADGKTFKKIAASPTGQTWSDLNWAPDAASLLLASTASGGSGSGPSLVLINADGSNPTPFGALQREYVTPQWSPSGDLVLFTRRDEAGGRAFWTATATASPSDAAENQVLAEVDKFVQARIHADIATAQDELDDAGRAAYDAGTSSLLSAPGTSFDRYYPVTVQLIGSNPNQFLVGVRIFITKSGRETSFFEEQLTLVLQDQRYVIHAVKASSTMLLGHGPTVVSVEIVATPPGEQVRVRFDADLNPDTVSKDTIQVKDADGNAVSERVTFDPDNHLATLAVKLRPGTYQLVVTTGVTDINGMALAQEYDAPLVINR